jgi:hypothetical protein
MELVIIFGPAAVGKMAVGMELEKLTDFKLFHNHMTIELVQPFFNYGTPMGKKLVGEFRRRLFEEISKSDLKGLIFTFVWAFDEPSEKDYIDSISKLFESEGATTSYVELYAPQEIRIERNKTELRLKNKKSKKDLSWSHNNLVAMDEKYKLNTTSEFYYPESYIKIDNTNKSPKETAQEVFKHFNY